MTLSWAKWKNILSFGWTHDFHRTVFGWHRAGGTWIYPAILAVSVTGVSISLHSELIAPIMGLVSRPSASIFDRSPAKYEDGPPSVSLARIVEMAGIEAARRGWVMPPDAVFFNRRIGVVRIRLGSGREAGLGPRWLYFEQATGTLISGATPLSGTAADRFVVCRPAWTPQQGRA